MPKYFQIGQAYSKKKIFKIFFIDMQIKNSPVSGGHFDGL